MHRQKYFGSRIDRIECVRIKFAATTVLVPVTATVANHAHRLIDAFIANVRADLPRSFADPLALFSVTTMLSLPIHDFAVFRGWFTAIASTITLETNGAKDIISFAYDTKPTRAFSI